MVVARAYSRQSFKHLEQECAGMAINLSHAPQSV
jgi:hypothetical protein